MRKMDTVRKEVEMRSAKEILEAKSGGATDKANAIIDAALKGATP